MREIRLLAAEDVDAYVTITVNAYPGFEMEAAATKERIRERTLASLAEENRRTTHLWGVFEGSALLGIFRLHDFEMNFRGRLVPVGGLGGVAVGLAHKKQRVAYEIVQFFLEHYRQRGVFLTALYPFRTDFYKKMGFGYGAKLNEYRVPPAALPRDGARERVRLLTAGDATAVHAFYQHHLQQQPGMMAKEEKEFARLLSSDTMHGAGFSPATGCKGTCSANSAAPTRKIG
jgi:predicted acetyltransferase